MSKNLRVFLLSVLVVVLGVTSAFAATAVTSADLKKGISDTKSTDLTFAGNILETISVSKKVDVTLTLTGDDNIKLSGDELFSFDKAITSKDSARLVITKSPSAARAVFVVLSSDWHIPDGVTVSIDVPFKVSAEASFDLKISVDKGGHLAFTKNVMLYDSNGNESGKGFPEGKIKTFNVAGTIEMANAQLFGKNVVTLVDGGTLKMPSDLKDLKISLDTEGTVDVASDFTLESGDFSGDLTESTLIKTGAGTLTLGVSGDLEEIKVNEGTVVLKGGVYTPAKHGYFTVSKDATLKLETGSVTSSGDVSFDVYGTVEFSDKAVSNADDYYPYFNFTPVQYFTINTKSVDLTVSGDAAKVIIKGMQAFSGVHGSGTIELAGDATSEDSNVLILTSDDFSDFEGKISGTKANIGLYGNEFDAKIFRSADLSELSNIIVYGGATLTVTSEDDIPDAGIWLRSDMPGYNKTLFVKVGQLIISSDKDFEVAGIKVDATTKSDGAATITGNVSEDNVLTISEITLYANKDVDFDGTYPASSVDLYALNLSGDLKFDGSKTKGDTTETGVVYVLSSADVTMTGDKPLASGTDLVVKSGAKLKVENGATLGGNVTFEAGKTPTSHDLTTALSKDAGVTFFQTSVTKNNKNDGTYAVKVAKKLTLPKTANSVGILANADGNAFADATATYGIRFKVIGSTAEVMSGDAKSFFMVSPDEGVAFQKYTDDKNGVTVELKDELLVLGLDGSYTFETDSTDFGASGGTAFVIKVPYTVKYAGNYVATPKSGDTRIINGVSEFYGLGELQVEFGTMEDDEFKSTDVGEYSDSKVSVKATVYYAESATATTENILAAQYINLSGTAYDPNVTLAMKISWTNSSAKTPSAAYQYTFSNKGSASQTDDGEEISDTEAEVSGDNEFTVGEDENFEFTITGMRRPTSTTTATPVLVNRVYVWRVMAVDGNWMMKDADGNWVEVDPATIRLKVTEGTEKDYIGSEDLTLTPVDNDTVLVSVPISKLGGTDGKARAEKTIALVAAAKYEAKTLISDPVTVVLLSSVSADKTVPVDLLTKTVTIGEVSSSDEPFYDITETDISGDVKFLDPTLADGSKVPEWFNWTGANRTLSYTIDPELLSEAGTYAFSVLAYSGTGTFEDAYKVMYTFTITVNGGSEPEKFAITASETAASMKVGDSKDITFTPANAASGDVNYSSDVDPAEGLEVAFESNVATLTATAAGTYTVTVTATDAEGNTAEAVVTVTVTESDKPDEPTVEGGIEGLATITVSVDGTAEAQYTLVSGEGTFTVSPADSFVAITEDGKLTVNAAGVEPDDYPFTITVTDASSNDIASRDVVVKVVANEPEPETEFKVKVALNAEGEERNTFENLDVYDDYTYYAVFETEGGSGKVEWTLEDNTYNKVLHSAESGDQFVVEGTVKIMPEDAEDTEQTFTVHAVCGEDSADYKVTFEVEEDEYSDYYKDGIFGELEGGDHSAVDRTYFVRFPEGYEVDPEEMYLPSWLEPVYEYDNDGEEILVGIKFASVVGELANGTEASVVIWAQNEAGYYEYYKWPVVYNAKVDKPVEEFKVTIDGDLTAIDLSNTKTITLVPTGGTVKGYNFEYDKDGLEVTYKGNVVTFVGKKPGQYTVKITATNEDDITVDVATITVTVPETPNEPKNFAVTPDKTSVQFVIGNSATVTFTPKDAAEGDIRYEKVVDPEDGLEVAFEGNVATFTATATGAYTVTIKATDAEDNEAEPVVIAVTVIEESEENFTLTARFPSTSFDISDSPVSFDLAAIVTPSNNQGSVRYSFSVDKDGLTATLSDGVVTLTATKTGTYKVTITGTDEAGSTDTATITVVVTSGSVGGSGGGCDAGFGALALALAAPLFLRRRRS